MFNLDPILGFFTIFPHENGFVAIFWNRAFCKVIIYRIVAISGKDKYCPEFFELIIIHESFDNEFYAIT